MAATVPTKINLDLAAEYLTPDTARFIKGLTNYVGATNSYDGIKEGQNANKLKSYLSNELYDKVEIPHGINTTIGRLVSKETNEVYVFIHNDIGNHFIYRINGNTRTLQIVYNRGECLDFVLDPRYFVHEGGSCLVVVNLTNPDTDETIYRKFLFWTTGRTMGFLCVDDSIATNSFDAVKFPYFAPDYYKKCDLIKFGLQTPLDCIKITEATNTDPEKPNPLRFLTWQFRILYIDVYGRPSEHGMISDMYISGGGNCLANSDLVARCLDLTFKISNPLIDKVQIEYRNCNDDQWYIEDVISLYKGSNLVEWWKRDRNPDIIFNQTTHEVTYRFCRDKECTPVPPSETIRTQNPVPRVSQAIAKFGKEIALINNDYGFSPFSDEVLKNISVEVLPPSTSGSTGLRDIKIAVAIYNPFDKRQKGIAIPKDDNPNKQSAFGGYFHSESGETFYAGATLLGTGKQLFSNPDQRGLIGILAGTGEPPITTISEQYYLDANNLLVKLDNYDNFDYTRTYFQIFEFQSVRPATYVFQLCAAPSKLSDTDYWKTSTHLYGSYSFGNNIVDFNNLINTDKQLIINVCDASYDGTKDNRMLVVYDTVIKDAAFHSDGTHYFYGASGYVYENKINGVNINPVELLKTDVAEQGTGGIRTVIYSTAFTDHNGYFFYTVRTIATPQDIFSVRLDIFGMCNQAYQLLIERFQLRGSGYIDYPFHLSNDGTCLNYQDIKCNRIAIHGRVKLCGTDIGVPGVGVVLHRSGYGITNSNGEYTIIAHDDSSVYNNTTGERTDLLYFMPTTCDIRDCNDACLGQVLAFILRQSGCTDRIFNAPDIEVKVSNKDGLLSGGRYGIGIVGHDTIRHNFVQTKDVFYVTMPPLITTKTFAPSTIIVNINPAATFPLWMDKISVYITNELTQADFITWIVDRFIFIDNGGVENKAAPTQIKIYYASLNEYNSQNNFNTTTGWGFIPENETSPRTSDYVEFIMNGDGTFFTKQIKAIVKYDKTGQYFLINYDKDLKDLKKYCLMRLVHPKVCIDGEPFFELCGSVDVVNGKAVSNSIILNAIDTYYVYRQIPIPVPDGDKTVNQTITFGFPFEHHSVNDLWGYKCKNIGRVNTKNPYEAEIHNPNQLALSGAISINGQLNYLNYFDEAKKTTFDISGNGIVFVYYEVGVAFLLCQNDHYTVGFNDNLLRVSSSGNVQGQIAGAFGNPERKVGSNFGVQLKDKNTIVNRNGLVMFVDTSRGELVQHSFTGIQAESLRHVDIKSLTKDKCDAWFRLKVKLLQADSNRYFIAGLNPVTNSYYLTDFSKDNRQYINNLRTYDANFNETVSFDIDSLDLKEFHPFTPEHMAYLDGDILNVQFFTFKNALPYSHYNVNTNKSYNIYYGVKTEKVLRIVYNKSPFNKKMFLSMYVFCKQQKFFADLIQTDSDQTSRLLLEAWQKAAEFYFASFYCSLNTIADSNLPRETGANKLLDGERLYGNYIDVRLVGDPKNIDEYCEVLGCDVEAFEYNVIPNL